MSSDPDQPRNVRIDADDREGPHSLDGLDLLRRSILFETPRRLTENSAWQMHLPFAFLLMSTQTPDVVVELGVHRGDSYCGWCQAVDVLGLSTRCYGIDNWEGDSQAGYYGNDVLNDLRGYHDPLYGHFSQLVQSTFDDAVSRFEDGTVDLLHIDGCHTYEAVARDFETWQSKLSSKGIALFHDTNERQGDFGVWRFWEEISRRYPSREFLFGHGLGVLAVGSAVPGPARLLFDLPEADWKALARFLCRLGERTHHVAERRIAGALGVRSAHELAAVLDAERSQAAAEREVFVRTTLALERELGQLHGDLAASEQQLAEAQEAIQQLILSLSWRITRPLRSAMQIARRARTAVGGSTPPVVSYQDWTIRYGDLDAEELTGVAADAAALEGPLISVVMPVYNPPPALLRQAIESVREQVYSRWELSIADDASTEPGLAAVFDDYGDDPRIRIARRETNGHISEASNTALEQVTGDFVAFLDHDDLLAPDALYLVAREIQTYPDADIVYSDEDKIDEDGKRYDPHFKPDYSPALLLGQNYISHLGVIRRSLVEAAGRFRVGYEGAQDYDLLLRCVELTNAHRIRHIPRILYHWRAIAGSTALAGDEKDYAAGVGRRAVQEHLDRTGVGAEVTTAESAAYNRIHLSLPEPRPLVSIVIPTKNSYELLKRCITSIVTRTTYGPYQLILVDNASDDSRALAYLDELAARDDCRVLRYSGPFNYSAMNNLAADHADGSLLLLLNNDTEVITPHWLDEMAMWAVQPDVGTVGAKLLYPDGTLQHGGIVLGIGGVAGHSHKGIEGSSGGYFSRLHLVHEVGGNTGACLAIRTELYRGLGGLNTSHLAIAFNDVDLCLRITEAGLRNIWTPHAVLTHHESKTRGYDDTPEKQARFHRERNYMLWRWRAILERDPLYSPNLTRETEDFALADPPRWRGTAAVRPTNAIVT